MYMYVYIYDMYMYMYMCNVHMYIYVHKIIKHCPYKHTWTFLLFLFNRLALSMASMGPYMEGEAVEYIAFLKDAYKYRLHSLLWSNQDRVAAFAASTRYVCMCVCVSMS